MDEITIWAVEDHQAEIRKAAHERPFLHDNRSNTDKTPGGDPRGEIEGRRVSRGVDQRMDAYVRQHLVGLETVQAGYARLATSDPEFRAMYREGKAKQGGRGN